MGNIAAAMLIGPLVPEDGHPHQVDLQHVTTEGSTAKLQSKQTDLEITQEYLKN